jgi:PIN domain nuclease of toxin-antitoxin system
LVQKKRFTVKDAFAVCAQRYISDLNLKQNSLSWKIAFESYFLPNHKDPADRFPVATAVSHDLTPVTSDQKLIGVSGLKVLANV